MLDFIYIPTHFAVHEYVDPRTFTRFGNNAIMFMDPRVLYTIDRIRERYGKPTYINTYKLKKYRGKYLSYRGFRPATYNGGADYSQHRHGRAIDLNVVEVTAEQIRQDILKNPWHEDFKYITCIEADVDWLHFDVRAHDKNRYGILIVKP